MATGDTRTDSNKLPAKPPVIGFVGLGEIGAPMARRILDAGWPLVLYARRAEALKPFEGTAAATVASLRELGRRADIVAVCVHDDAQLEAVALGSADDGVFAGLRAGGILVVHSTVNRDTCLRLAEAAAPRGIDVVDAPISGGPDGARTGTLAVMAGGTAPAVERCRPVFESFARTVRRVGPLGCGQAAKAINNALYAAQGKLVDEAVAVGERLGIDRRTLIDVLQSGSADSFVLRRYGVTASLQYWLMHRGTATGNVVNVLEKDAQLYANLAAAKDEAPGDVARLSEAFVAALRELERRH
jgi:3-hydroxyisobutyrate dehydrogenase